MFLANPYDHRTLKLLRLEDSIHAINQYIATDDAFGNSYLNQFKPFSGNSKYIYPVFLTGKSAIEKDITSLGHPLLCLKHNWIALDLRQYLKVDKETGSVQIRNNAEYTLAMNRFILSGMWATDKGNVLYSNALPMLVYGDWISQNLTRVLGLGMGDQVKLFILGCMYYTSQFTTGFGKEDIEKLKIKLVKEVFSEDLIDEVAESVDTLETVEDLCRLAYKVTDNIRLKNLDYITFTNILSNNWFGLNAGEMTKLCLGHPPTWIALVFSSISDRGYRNTFIAKTAEVRGKRGRGEDFVREMNNTFKLYKE